MIVEIKHRRTGAVLCSTDVPGDASQPLRVALELAVSSDADLRDANLGGAYLGDAYLRGANLGGANLGGANLGDADLRDANLGGAYLGGANLGGAYLGGANLGDADLRGAYLGGAYLGDADLRDAYLGGAYLGDAYLRDADLRGARNVPIGTVSTDPIEPYVRAVTDEQRKARDAKHMARFRERHPEVPVIPDLDRKILELIEIGSLILDMSQWHGAPNGTACGTTHCRAGSAIFLAGEVGKQLERDHGPHRAGAMIYRASTGRVPHFFATDERALEDIKRCAAEQAEVAP